MDINIENKSKRSVNPFASITGRQIAAKYGIFLVLLLMIVGLTILTLIIRGEQYLLALQASINAIIAIGMTFVIISGGVDLAVGVNHGTLSGDCGAANATLMESHGQITWR